MPIKDRGVEYVIATFQPGRTSSGDTIKFLANADPVYQFSRTDVEHIKPIGGTRICDISDLNSWLAQPLREPQVDFLKEFFRDLINAVTRLDEAQCREINSDESLFQVFLAEQFRVTMQRFRQDEAKWEDFFRFWRLHFDVDSYGQDLVDRDIEQLENIFKNLRLSVRKIVGKYADPDRSIHERNCPY